MFPSWLLEPRGAPIRVTAVGRPILRRTLREDIASRCVKVDRTSPGWESSAAAAGAPRRARKEGNAVSSLLAQRRALLLAPLLVALPLVRQAGASKLDPTQTDRPVRLPLYPFAVSDFC